MPVCSTWPLPGTPLVVKIFLPVCLLLPLHLFLPSSALGQNQLITINIGECLAGADVDAISNAVGAVLTVADAQWSAKMKKQGNCSSVRGAPQQTALLQQPTASLALPISGSVARNGIPAPWSQSERDVAQWNAKMKKKLLAQMAANREMSAAKREKSGYLGAVPAKLRYQLECACKLPICRKHFRKQWHQSGGPPSFPLPQSFRQKTEKRLGPLKACNRIMPFHFRSEHRKTARYQLTNVRRPGSTMGIEIPEEEKCDPTMEPGEIELELQLADAIMQRDAPLFDIVSPHIYGESDTPLSIADLQAVIDELEDISAAKELVLKLVSTSRGASTYESARTTMGAEEEAAQVDETAEDLISTDEAGRDTPPPNNSTPRLRATLMEVDDMQFRRSARGWDAPPIDAKSDGLLKEVASTDETTQSKDEGVDDTKLAVQTTDYNGDASSKKLEAETDAKPEATAAAATVTDGGDVAATLDIGTLDTIDFGLGGGEEWDTASSKSDNSYATSESKDSYASLPDMEIAAASVIDDESMTQDLFTFNGNTYLTYQDSECIYFCYFLLLHINTVH